jgi:hypothetical protein
LGFGLAATSSISAPLTAARSQARDARAFLLASRLLDAHPSQESLSAIGHAFIDEVEETGADCPACLSDAVDALLDRLDWRDADLLQMKPARIRAGIKRKAIGDFERGRIVQVGGWLLGETEIRLCTVAALHSA